MLGIQSGEIATRLRTMLRLVGRVPAQLDETVVPILNLGGLDRAPYRSDPVELIGLGAANGAAGAGVFNWVGAVLPAAAGGVAIIRRVTVYAREALAAGTTVVPFLLAAGTDPTGFVDATGAVLVEPPSRPAAGGGLFVTPVRIQTIATTIALLNGNQCAEYIEQDATSTGAHTFDIPGGIMLLPNTWVAATINGTDAGAATVEVGASFFGEYYSSLPDR